MENKIEVCNNKTLKLVNLLITEATLEGGDEVINKLIIRMDNYVKS